MKRNRRLIIVTLALCGLLGLIPLGMQVWAVSVLKAEAREETLGIAWNADRYSVWLAKASLIKDAKCHPVIITLFGEPRDANRLARAIPWARHLYSIRIHNEQSSVAALCEAATKVPGLRVLQISDTMLDKASVASLSKLTNLEALHIYTRSSL